MFIYKLSEVYFFSFVIGASFESPILCRAIFGPTLSNPYLPNCTLPLWPTITYSVSVAFAVHKIHFSSALSQLLRSSAMCSAFKWVGICMKTNERGWLIQKSWSSEVEILMCKMHCCHGGKSIFCSVIILLGLSLFVTLTVQPRMEVNLCERKRVSQLRLSLVCVSCNFRQQLQRRRQASSQFTGIATFELWTDIGSCPLWYRLFSTVTLSQTPLASKQAASP